MMRSIFLIHALINASPHQLQFRCSVDNCLLFRHTGVMTWLFRRHPPIYSPSPQTRLQSVLVCASSDGFGTKP